MYQLHNTIHYFISYLVNIRGKVPTKKKWRFPYQCDQLTC